MVKTGLPAFSFMIRKQMPKRKIATTTTAATMMPMSVPSSMPVDDVTSLAGLDGEGGADGNGARRAAARRGATGRRASGGKL